MFYGLCWHTSYGHCSSVLFICPPTTWTLCLCELAALTACFSVSKGRNQKPSGRPTEDTVSKHTWSIRQVKYSRAPHGCGRRLSITVHGWKYKWPFAKPRPTIVTVTTPVKVLHPSSSTEFSAISVSIVKEKATHFWKNVQKYWREPGRQVYNMQAKLH